MVDLEVLKVFCSRKSEKYALFTKTSLLDYMLEVVLSFLSSLCPLHYYKAKKHPLSFFAQCTLEPTLIIYSQQHYTIMELR